MKAKMGKSLFSSFGASLKIIRSKESLMDLPLASLNIISRQGASAPRESVVSQARIICEDYIHDKLDSFGLLKNQLNLNSNKKSQVSLSVIAIGAELERRHPKVYRDISRKLNMTMRDENVVDKTLTKILEQLFDVDTTWAKVISMFALAGQFALECVQQGHPEFVKVVVDSVVLFVTHHLVDWIVARGGWTEVIPAFRKRKESGALRLFTVVGTVVGLLATVVATIRIR